METDHVRLGYKMIFWKYRNKDKWKKIIAYSQHFARDFRLHNQVERIFQWFMIENPTESIEKINIKFLEILSIY